MTREERNEIVRAFEIKNDVGIYVNFDILERAIKILMERGDDYFVIEKIHVPIERLRDVGLLQILNRMKDKIDKMENCLYSAYYTIEEVPS